MISLEICVLDIHNCWELNLYFQIQKQNEFFSSMARLQKNWVGVTHKIPFNSILTYPVCSSMISTLVTLGSILKKTAFTEKHGVERKILLEFTVSLQYDDLWPKVYHETSLLNSLRIKAKKSDLELNLSAIFGRLAYNVA